MKRMLYGTTDIDSNCFIGVIMKRKIEEVFVTEGVPQFTFVQPPNYGEIFVDLRKPGKPVIIEGQSGTGKTTCIKKIIERLPEISAVYLSARKAEDISAIEGLASSRSSGCFIIDDFHRLKNNLQMRLAEIAKIAAEEGDGTKLPKLVLIGINKLGSNLVYLVPDVAKRIGVHKIKQGTETEVCSLIEKGCSELNVTMKNASSVFSETKGDYWLTQLIMQNIAILNDVYETQDSLKNLIFDLSQIRSRVIEKLDSSFSEPVKEFCRGRRFRPSNDPYFKLLRAIGSQDQSIVDLNELSSSRPDIKGSINNIKEKRLVILLDEKPICSRYFYYNSSNKCFAIEDPTVFYYLKNLNWDRLQVECGFRAGIPDREFDFAISFAGENRELAEFLAEQLEILDANVFYDRNYESNYLGKTWTKQFEKVFGEDSDKVICLLDINHRTKIWPTFEREIFAKRVVDEDVIPIFLDNTIFPGIPADLIGFKYTWDKSDPSWKDTVIDKIVFKILV